MTKITALLLFIGSKGEKNLQTLFSLDANLSCIDSKCIEGLELSTPLGRTRRIATPSEGHYIEFKYRVSLDFYMEDVLLSDEFLVVPGLSEEVIIGAATMQKWRIKLDFEHDKAIIDPKVGRIELISNSVLN